MTTTLTSKGQVTVPKQIRDALHLQAGQAVHFEVNDAGQIVLLPNKAPNPQITIDRFDAVRGRASIKWRTDDLMRMLRQES